MSLQSSGAISLGQIQSEFGGSEPIGMSEYYRNGAYVMSNITQPATVSGMTYTESQSAKSNWGGNYSNFWRYYENGSGYLPTINNTGSWLFGYSHWTDQAWTNYVDNWVDSSMTIDVEGTYIVKMTGYNTGATRSSEIYLNGSQIASVGLNQEHEFTAAAGDTLRIVSHMNTIGNYNSLTMNLYTSNYNTTVDKTVNGTIPEAGAVSLGSYFSTEAPWATVRMLATTATDGGTYNATLDCTGSDLWMVVCHAYGEASGATVPAAPVVNGVSLPLRVSRTTNYSDDGAAAAIYAGPISSDSTTTFSFTTDGSGYGNNRTAIYLVEGAPSDATVNTASTAGDRATSITVDTPDTYSAAFVANASHKSGVGSVSGEDGSLVYGGCGADKFHDEATKTFTIYGQACVAFSISYMNNTPVPV